MLLEEYRILGATLAREASGLVNLHYVLGNRN